jgi:chromatin assembly factor 1 subunit A
MDPNTSLSPMPPAQPIPPSPSTGPRKRSIHEVDDAATPSPNAKRALTEYTAENQENRDPSLSSRSGDVAAAATSLPTDSVRDSLPRPSVEIVVRNSSRGSNSPQTAEPDTPASKKRKAATVNHDAKQQEKDAKERQRQEEKVKREEERAKREEEKAKREEEKRLKAEEKKKRDAERDEEKKKREAEREEEKKQREEKKKAKEDEKAAKEAAKEEEKRKKDEEKEKNARVSGLTKYRYPDMLTDIVPNEVELILRQTFSQRRFFGAEHHYCFAQ